MAQPATRIALVGKWRSVGLVEARRNALYGTSGIMVSLMVGMLLNVPMRALEFLAVMPPVPSGSAQWLLTLRFAMTLDVVIFSSLYMVAFVAACPCSHGCLRRSGSRTWRCKLVLPRWLGKKRFRLASAVRLRTCSTGIARRF